MTEQQGDRDFIPAARDALREAEQDLAPEVNERLAQARRAAVASVDERQRPYGWLPRLAGSGALAVAMLIVVFVVSRPSDTLPLLDDNEMAAAQEVEMLEELEFLAWMVAREEADEESGQG